MGSALLSERSILEPSSTGCVRRGESFWKFLIETAPKAPPLPKSYHTILIKDSRCRKIRKGSFMTTKWVCFQGSAGAAIHNLRFEINITEFCYLPSLCPLLFQKYYYDIPTPHNTKSCISLKCQCFCYLCYRINLHKPCHSRTGQKIWGRHPQIPTTRWRNCIWKSLKCQTSRSKQQNSYAQHIVPVKKQRINNRYRHNQYTS